MRIDRFAYLVTLALTLPTVGQNISSSTLTLVVARLAESATHSWELGTRAQALTELNAPLYSVLSPSASLPPPVSPPQPSGAFLEANLTDVLQIAKQTVVNMGIVGNSTFVADPTPKPLVGNDGSSGDPASLGAAVLLANWTFSALGSTTNGAGNGSVSQAEYAAAAEAQLRYLLEVVPRTSDGAISHRANQAQLWCVKFPSQFKINPS